MLGLYFDENCVFRSNYFNSQSFITSFKVMENAIRNNYFDRNNYLIYSHKLSYLFNIIIFVWVFHSLRYYYV